MFNGLQKGSINGWEIADVGERISKGVKSPRLME